MSKRNEKVLKIVPYGGLCNRLLFINAIHEYAINNNYKVICYWFMNNEIYADPFKIFDLLNSVIKFIIIDTKSVSGAVLQFIYKVFRKMGFINDQLMNFDYINIDNSNSKFINNFDKYTYSTGCQNFYSHYSKNIFGIKYSYVNKAESILQNYETHKVVALHIRRTDHLDSKKVTTDDKVRYVIEKEISHGNKIFIACDDLEFKNKLANEFKDNIIYQNVLSVNRDSFESIEYAVIDLVCLSKCKKVYGSFRSTFSSFAAFLGNIELEIIE